MGREMGHQSQFDWVIINQTHNDAFVRMLESITSTAPGLLYTGTPTRARMPNLQVELGPAHDRASLGRRAASWARFTLSAFARCAKLEGSPFVFVVTNPPLLPAAAWLLKQTCGLRYGLLVWDIYPHHMVHAGWLAERGLPTTVWHHLNRRTLEHAEVVITLGQRMAETLRHELDAEGAAKAHICVIPNWADTERIRPLPKADNPFAREHDQTDKITVLYSGNLGRTHGLTSLVEAAKLLEHDPRFSFVIIGDGLGRNDVRRTMDRLRVTNVKLLGWQPADRLPLSLTTGDIAVVSQEPGTEALSVPSKTYSALAAGSALLALTAPDSDLADLVRSHQVGLVAPNHCPRAIGEALKRLAESENRLRVLQHRARAVALQHFSAAAIARQLRECLSPHIEEEG